MAIIPIDIRTRIATRLANDNYKDSMHEVQENLKLHVIAKLEEVIPKRVQETFKMFPKHFYHTSTFLLYSNHFKKLLPKDWGSRPYYGSIDLGRDFPVSDNMLLEWAQNLPSNDYICTLISNFYKLEMERYFMEKRLKCIMTATRYTGKKLKEDFPEAYQVYMDIITSDSTDTATESNEATQNLCDSVENIRAQLKKNRNVEKDIPTKQD